MKKTLSQIGLLNYTDKSTYHGFTDFYDKHLCGIRDSDINLLEIGIYQGASLRTWKEYFQNGIIHGMDIAYLQQYQEERILIEQGDQTDVSRLKNVFDNVEFDVIVDDGGHTMNQQQVSLVNIFSRLKTGGLYILEDLHTSISCYVNDFSEDLNKNTTLSLIEKFEKKECNFDNYFVSESEIKSVFDNIEFCEVSYTNGGMSITSIIKKK